MIVDWFAFVILAVHVGGQIGQQHVDDIDQYSGDSRVAEELITDDFVEVPAMESLIGESERGLEATARPAAELAV